MIDREEKPLSTAYLVETLWKFACTPPEESRGSVANQVRACRMLWNTYHHEPALRRLNEIAAIKASRTKGKVRGQQSAEKLLTTFLKAIKPDKSQQLQ